MTVFVVLFRPAIGSDIPIACFSSQVEAEDFSLSQNEKTDPEDGYCVVYSVAYNPHTSKAECEFMSCGV